MELNQFEQLNKKINSIKDDVERLGYAITYFGRCVITSTDDSDSENSIILHKAEDRRVRQLLIDMKIEKEKQLIELIGKLRFNGADQIELEELINEGTPQ